MYRVYFNDLIFPICPEKIETQFENKNKSFTTISGSEINKLNLPGLETISFSLLLPNMQYTYGQYNGPFRKADYYVEFLKDLKNNKKIFTFAFTKKIKITKLANAFPDEKTARILRGKGFDWRIDVEGYSLICSLEDLSFREAYDQGRDVVADVMLKRYEEIETYKITDGRKRIIKKRPIISKPETGDTYTVNKDTNLWTFIKQKEPDLTGTQIHDRIVEIMKKNGKSMAELPSLPVGTVLNL